MIDTVVAAYEADTDSDRAQFMRDFLKHPNQFELTDLAKCAAYTQLVLRDLDGRGDVWNISTKMSDIDWTRIRDIRASVEYEYSTTMGKQTAVLFLEAEVRHGVSLSWEKARYGSVAFCLDDWVRRA